MDTGEIFFEKFALFLLVDVNQQAPHLEWRGLKKHKNDTSKIDSIGFKTDTAEFFFEKFALFLLVTQNQQAPHLEWRGLKKQKQEQVCSENTCGPAYRVLFF